jgi:predicted HicB family RNase H-like nuclease
MSLGKDKKRFTLDIDNKIHTEIKVRATLRHTSIQNYILESIAMRIVREDIVTQQEKQPVKAAG